MNAAKDLNPLPSWGSDLGLIDLRGPSPVDSNDPTANRILAVETLYRYGWAYDERNYEVLAACFTEDTVFLGNVGGTVQIGPFNGRKAFLEWLTAFWGEQRDQRRHIVLNPVVDDLTDSTVSVSSLMLLTSTENATFKATTAGFYRTTMRKEEGIWRIATFTAGFDAPF